MPYCIPDDPIISAMERGGYPPWMGYYDGEEEDDGEEMEA